MLNNIGLPGLIMLVPVAIVGWLVIRALWRVGSKK